ncbi:ionic transporter y4hA [Elizabethkingia argentiflava]|uniref:Ionic transporter y4hA n=1 Tax=Elizabethkingia argenteiflava TaxID=2681556 RepID=A0A845PVD5_9FLAO|nr:ionic transporter y4hA [Elizabethkingia argenteiflava]NAW52182.1 ionic transporter y4hA [Elizabethkingia argenteiflava]
MSIKIFQPVWTFLLPLLAWGVYLLEVDNILWIIFSAFLLVGCVLAAVLHAETIAHRLGEPFGTIILAIAITIIEVALIISLMVAGGPEAETLPRDTVFAAIMLILNGIIGLCLLLGGAKFHEQYFGKKSANTALITLISILVLTLVLPNYTTSVRGPYYNSSQLIFVAIISLILYGSFIMVQTVRHKDYFVADEEETQAHEDVTTSKLIMALTFLVLCLGIVVLLAKTLSPSIENMVKEVGAPKSLVGVIIAAVVLLPESIAAIKAAQKNQLQTSLNLALGSALASIGLTIPSVVIVCLIYNIDLVLGIDIKFMVLLALSFFIVMLSLNQGKTNVHYGIVLLVSLAAYIFTVIVP